MGKKLNRIIYSCDECTFIANSTYDISFWCEHSFVNIPDDPCIIDDIKTIPKWCPLENANEQ